MRRRRVIGLIGAAVWPLTVLGQQLTMVYRIAVLTLGAPLSDMTVSGKTYIGELRRHGVIE